MGPRQVVARYLAQVVNGADPAALEHLVSNRALREELAGFHAAFPDVTAETRILIEGGNVVAVNLSAAATHLGPFRELAPTGRRWRATCSAFFLVRHEAIEDAWVNWDLLSIFQQLGALGGRAGPAGAATEPLGTQRTTTGGAR